MNGKKARLLRKAGANKKQRREYTKQTDADKNKIDDYYKFMVAYKEK